jgi:hypothetical protein
MPERHQSAKRMKKKKKKKKINQREKTSLVL